MEKWNFVDHFLKNQRIKQTKKMLADILNKDSVVLDIGCGYGYFLRNISDLIKKGLGIDQKIEERIEGNLKFINLNFDGNPLPFEKNSMDVVVMMAVIEHLIYPDAVFKEVYRVLKKGGVLVFTTPSPELDIFLIILAALKISSKKAVRDHKLYFTKSGIDLILKDTGFKNITLDYFQLGLNMKGRFLK